MAQKKIYILGYDKTYLGNRTNAKKVWTRVTELLGEEGLTISYIGEDPEYYETMKGSYQNMNNAFKIVNKLIIHLTDDFEKRVTVWLGYINEG